MCDEPTSQMTDDRNDAAGAEAEHTDAALVEDVLVEEVSIDGMCGVY